MGKTSADSKAATLMAAVSIIGLSVGMTPAAAEDANKGVLIGLSQQDKHSTQVKQSTSNQYKESNQLKLQGSNQLKLENHYLKYDSNQHKADSHQLKYESQQIKGESVQRKNSTQMKQNTHSLNPQPLPPG